MILAVLVVLVQGNADSLATRVRQITDTYLTAYFERHPDEATLDGVAHTRHDRLPDNSPNALARWRQREDVWLPELEGLAPAPLAGRPEWIAYGIMRDALEGSIATRVCRFELWSVAHTGGGWLALKLTGSLPLMFVAVGAALLIYGAGVAIAIRMGAWFRPSR